MSLVCLFIRVKPKHKRMHLESDSLQEKQLNNSTNLVDVSRALLRIAARLPKTEDSNDSPIKNSHGQQINNPSKSARDFSED